MKWRVFYSGKSVSLNRDSGGGLKNKYTHWWLRDTAVAVHSMHHVRATYGLHFTMESSIPNVSILVRGTHPAQAFDKQVLIHNSGFTSNERRM